MAKIIAVCKSRKKGTRKEAIAEGIIREDYGLVGDAHARIAEIMIMMVAANRHTPVIMANTAAVWLTGCQGL